MDQINRDEGAQGGDQDEVTVEELETSWWEPMGCSCDVDFKDE